MVIFIGPNKLGDFGDFGLFCDIFCIWAEAANFVQRVKKVDFTTAIKDNGMKLKGAYKAAFVLCNRVKKWVILGSVWNCSQNSKFRIKLKKLILRKW